MDPDLKLRGAGTSALPSLRRKSQSQSLAAALQAGKRGEDAKRLGERGSAVRLREAARFEVALARKDLMPVFK